MKFLTFLLFVCVVVIPFRKVYPIIKFRHDHALLPDFARWIAKNTEADAVIIERDDNRFHEYYGHRKTLTPLVGLYTLDHRALELFGERVDNLLEQDIPVYITGTGLLGYNPSFQFDEFIEDRYELELVGSQRSEDWHFGSLIQLVGPIHLYKIRKK